MNNEVYKVQRKFKFPGLVQECRKLLTKYELPKIIEETCKLTKNRSTNIVRRNIRTNSKDHLVLLFKEYSKLKEGPLLEDGLDIQPYVQN